jgi:hypothetical protein
MLLILNLCAGMFVDPLDNNLSILKDLGTLKVGRPSARRRRAGSNALPDTW